MSRFGFWRAWLLATSAGVVVFGILLALWPHSAWMDSVFNRRIDAAFWAGGAVPGAALRFQAWAYGVTGSVMAGWGLTLFFLVRHAFGEKRRWAWNALASGCGLWFVLDTSLSAVHGVGFNVLFNTGLLLALALPLAATRRHCSQRPG